MQLRRALAEQTDLRKKSGHRFISKFWLFLRHGNVTSRNFADSLIERGQSFYRVTPGVAVIRNKLLKDGLSRRLAVLRLGFEPDAHPRQVRKERWGPEKPPDPPVGIFSR